MVKIHSVDVSSFVQRIYCSFTIINLLILSIAGSRILRRRGAYPPGAPTYGFAKFLEKPHQIEKISVSRVWPSPARSATAVSDVRGYINSFLPESMNNCYWMLGEGFVDSLVVKC